MVSSVLALVLLGLLSTRAHADGPYTYSWNASSWVTSAGTATCAESTLQTQTRTVSCQRDDGEAADASLCDPTQQPAAFQYQYLTDYTSCTYSWTVSDWSPAAGASCTNSLTQSRLVTCQRSDATAVDPSFCSGAGAAPAVSQSVIDTGACTYGWVGSGFSACQDSTATNNPSWLYTYSGFVPTLGCGSTTQTRSYTCSAVASSGSQSQTVSCLRSDGTTADNSKCAGSTPPVTSQACTPQTPHCDVTTLGATSHTSTLTNGCAGTGQAVSGGTAPVNGNIPSPAAGYDPQTPACVPDALNTIHCRCVPNASTNTYCIYFNMAGVTS
jgi:hypothetical protein